jgi:hypothetical protein
MPTIQCLCTQGGGGLAEPNLTTNFYNSSDPFAFDSPPRFYTLRPDLTDLPSGATINSVNLKLYSEVAFSSQVVSIWECLKAWVAGQVSGNNYSTGNAWEAVGGSGASDRGASALATITAAGTDDGVQLTSTAISTALIAAWKSGATVNNGFLLYAPTGTFVDWTGSADATNPPVLEINYSTGTAYTLEPDTVEVLVTLSDSQGVEGTSYSLEADTVNGPVVITNTVTFTNEPAGGPVEVTGRKKFGIGIGIGW